MQSGIMYGAVDAMEGIVRRIWEELGVQRTTVVATGGLVNIVSSQSKIIDHIEPSLVLEGVRIIVERNQKR
jgi:type III pantothenate kinase